jgi:hypothetical protein
MRAGGVVQVVEHLPRMRPSSSPTTTKKQKVSFNAGYQRLTLVILATREVEITRTAIPSQPRQIVYKTLSRKKTHHKKGLVEWFKM